MLCIPPPRLVNSPLGAMWPPVGNHCSSPMPMAPNERAYMASYSSLVRLAVSSSVSKLQPSEICVTSILTSQGHSRSKPMAPNERGCMTSYPSVIVNWTVSASISKLQPSEICVTSILTSQGHSRSKPMAPNERGCIYIIFIHTFKNGTK